MRLFLLMLMVMGEIFSLYAQSDQQLSLDFQTDYPATPSILLESTLGYSTVFGSEKWRSLSWSPNITYTNFRRIEFYGELPVSYTVQKENFNTWELTPTLGAKYFFSQGKRFDARFGLKGEERLFFEKGSADLANSTRLRLKGEVYISINGPSLFTDKLWYAILDYEEFIVLDEQLNERYSNRRRARIGVGYRSSYRNRWELIYARQSSRNEIEGDFLSDDNIIFLRYKLYLNAAKPDQDEL
jgi:hypothetical protein